MKSKEGLNDERIIIKEEIKDHENNIEDLQSDLNIVEKKLTMKLVNLQNGIFLDLITGITQTDFDLFHSEKRNEGRKERRERTYETFRIEQCENEERRFPENERRKSRIPTREDVMYLLKKDGYYIHWNPYVRKRKEFNNGWKK